MSNHAIYRRARNGKLATRNGERVLRPASAGDIARRLSSLATELRTDRKKRDKRKHIDHLLAIDRKRKESARQRERETVAT